MPQPYLVDCSPVLLRTASAPLEAMQFSTDKAVCSDARAAAFGASNLHICGICVHLGLPGLHSTDGGVCPSQPCVPS